MYLNKRWEHSPENEKLWNRTKHFSFFDGFRIIFFSLYSHRWLCWWWENFCFYATHDYVRSHCKDENKSLKFMYINLRVLFPFKTTKKVKEVSCFVVECHHLQILKRDNADRRWLSPNRLSWFWVGGKKWNFHEKIPITNFKILLMKSRRDEKVKWKLRDIDIDTN